MKKFLLIFILIFVVLFGIFYLFPQTTQSEKKYALAQASWEKEWEKEIEYLPEACKKEMKEKVARRKFFTPLTGYCSVEYLLKFWKSDLVVNAAAICHCESGGNPLAYNPKGPDESYGLFQINCKGGLRGNLARKCPKKAYCSPAEYRKKECENPLYQPEINNQVAKTLSGNGQNWRPWSCAKKVGIIK